MTYTYGTETYTVGGCFRLDPEGIYLHENDKHASIGVAGFELNGEFLKINWTKANPIVAIHVSVDETIGGKFGIIAGGSGGAAYINVALYDTRIGRRLDLSNEKDYARAASRVSNLWVQAVHLKT